MLRVKLKRAVLEILTLVEEPEYAEALSEMLILIIVEASRNSLIHFL